MGSGDNPLPSSLRCLNRGYPRLPDGQQGMEQGLPDSLKLSRRGRRKKGKIRQLLEYGVVAALILVMKGIPFSATRLFSRVFGEILYVAIPKRRALAIENLRHALGSEKTEEEITNLARKSWQSFCLTCIEIIKLHD